LKYYFSYIDGKKTYNAGSPANSPEGNNDFYTYIGQAKSLDEIFNQAAQQYNLPVELLKAVGKTESNFNSNAVSRCGAQGVMQLMPETAKAVFERNAKMEQAYTELKSNVDKDMQLIRSAATILSESITNHTYGG
jgi:soluble lytic murein transglycosylase-like protein